MSTLWRSLYGFLGVVCGGVAIFAGHRPDNCVEISLTAYAGLWSIKVFLDDSAHFQSERNASVWATGLGLSMLWIMFMASSARVATIDPHRAILYALFAQGIGVLWIAQNYLHKKADASAPEKRRHLVWVYINCTNILALATASTYLETHPKRSSILLWALTALTLFDFLYFGTLQRVARAFGPKPAAGSVPPAVVGI
jgi:hypothetical protein